MISDPQSGTNGRGTTARALLNGLGSSRHAILLRIEAPSAAAAFVLAGSLGKSAARATLEEDRWVVLVSLGSGGPSAITEALSATREWLLECNVAATTLSYDGQTHVMRREDAKPLTQSALTVDEKPTRSLRYESGAGRPACQ